MNSEHLAGCSSLTAGELLSQLDDLLWNHENSYLYERERMSDNTRDRQFANFAHVVYMECFNIAQEAMLNNRIDTDQRVIQHIARRAHDLVKHTLLNVDIAAIDACPVEEHVARIPDMTELPKDRA